MSTGEILCRERSKCIEWKFGNFSSKFKTEYYIIESPTFPFKRAWWHLQIFPHAQHGDSGFMTVSLYRKNADDPENCISGRIGILRDNGTVYTSHRFQHYNFSSKTSSFSLCFLRTSTLWADISQITPRDEVTFFCWLTSADEECKEAETQTSEPEGICKLSKDIKDLYLNAKDYDTTIKIADREFHAHRLILGARSPVFASMYSHDTSERISGIVEIEDCHPEVFQDFLLFLYSGKVESLSSENVLGLYAVADKYDVQEMKQECLKFMLSNFSVEGFCDVITLAVKYSESELLKSASEYFVKNAKKISVTPQWLRFHRDYPVESNELCIKAFQLLPD